MPTFGGGGERCIHCTKTVYPAEKVTTSSGNIFHKNCCRCTTCNKLLQPATASESSKTHRVYCKVHYMEIQTTGKDEASAPLVLAPKKVELEEESETLHEGAKAWVELAPSLLTSVPALTPAEGSAECFVRATVSKLDGDKCVIQTDAGVECTVPSKLVMKADGGGAQSNNLMLVELNEPSLLHNLRARFDAQIVYTYTGELELLCLNPHDSAAKVPVFAVLPLACCAFPGRAWRLRAAWHSQSEAPATERPATAAGARASRLQRRRFHLL